jgi:hypothetical protein
MSEIILFTSLIIVTLVVIGLFLLFYVIKKKKELKIEETNYQAFFNIGLIWIPVGIVFIVSVNIAIGVAFFAMGTSYMAIGLANRDKWEKKQK